MIQPVFHIYDLSYYFCSNLIIEKELPKKNKYTNFQDIKTIYFDNLTSIELSRFVQFINNNYLRNLKNNNIFSPKLKNIVPYFTGHNDHKCFISFYFIPNNYIEQTSINTTKIITDEKIIGCITSRPLNITFSCVSDFNNFNKIYYVDYLCVDKNYRKKGIAPQIIQTHHFNQRHKNTNISVSLFKREEELTGIVPLTTYYTYGFSIEQWNKPEKINCEYKLIEANSTNYIYLWDFIKLKKMDFDIFIFPEIYNIFELIKTNNLIIYFIILDNEIQSCYFYRKTCIQIDKNNEVLSCIASICGCDDELFIQGFKLSFWEIVSKQNNKKENINLNFCAIENISHNYKIINNITKKIKPLICSPTAYFFYNFIFSTIPSNKLFIIN